MQWYQPSYMLNQTNLKNFQNNSKVSYFVWNFVIIFTFYDRIPPILLTY